MTDERENDDARMEFRGSSEESLRGLFNTFRMGDKWADLEPGDTVDLVLTKYPDNAEHELNPRPAVVGAVCRGPLHDMLAMHSGLNHGCSQSQPADRRIELWRILRDMYGIENVKDGDACVVVYLYRAWLR